MIKPDIIVSWPDNCDYPLWRLFIHESRKRFDQVYVVFTKTNAKPNFEKFVFLQMFKDNVSLLNAPIVKSGQDWRDNAVKFGLSFSQSEWVWFTEQDFEVKPGFFDYIENKQIDGLNVIAAYQGDRMHPCSIFITRALLRALNVSYDIMPGVGDHFCKLQKEIEIRNIPVAKIPDHLYKHYNGLSHNWRLVCDDQFPNYKIDDFMNYLKACIDAPVNLDNTWKEIAQNMISAYYSEIVNK